MDSSQLTRIEELEMELIDKEEEMAHLHEKMELELLEKEVELDQRTLILERKMEEKELEMELLTEEIEMEIEELDLEEINYLETRREGLVTKRVKYIDDSNLTTKTYYITQNTSVEELNKIQAAATKAGIKMEYTAKVNKDRIKKID